MRVTRRTRIFGCLVVLMMLVGALLSETWIGDLVKQRLPWVERSFPDVTADHLSPLQESVIGVLRAEYDANPAGTKYSEGHREPWCADFVSWVLRKAGSPLSNPNSGSWRIPGVYTLTEYFQSHNRFHSAQSGYVPKPGDVVIYSPKWRFGQHTNFAVAINGGTLTTVGGNEGGVNRGTVEMDDPAIVGFGAL